MAKKPERVKCGTVEVVGDTKSYPPYLDYPKPRKQETNGDRIRSMSDEELACELMTWRIETAAQYHGVQSDYPNTQKTILEWLKQPAEEGE